MVWAWAVVLPVAFMAFTQSFLLANKECQAIADSDIVSVHIKPVTTRIANIASVAFWFINCLLSRDIT